VLHAGHLSTFPGVAKSSTRRCAQPCLGCNSQVRGGSLVAVLQLRCEVSPRGAGEGQALSPAQRADTNQVRHRTFGFPPAPKAQSREALQELQDPATRSRNCAGRLLKLPTLHHHRHPTLQYSPLIRRRPACATWRTLSRRASASGR
jgi:hypothetical protein